MIGIVNKIEMVLINIMFKHFLSINLVTYFSSNMFHYSFASMHTSHISPSTHTNLLYLQINKSTVTSLHSNAATEGGWMSDYDTFPLRMDASSSSEEEDYNILPNGGTFTAHERAVPSLVSASQSEWERVSRLLLDAIPTHDGLITDMYMLESIRLSNIKNGNNNNKHGDDEDAGISFVPMRKEVQQGFPYKRIVNTGVGKRRRIVNCEIVKRTKAMHFSHDSTAKAVGRGKFPLEGISKVNPAVERRGRAALEFLRDWKEQCWKKEMQQQRQRLGGDDGLLMTKV